jgi:hypothetical protein
VEDLMSEFPHGWQREWLRLRAKSLKDDQLGGWADYYEKLEKQFERNYLCASA